MVEEFPNARGLFLSEEYLGVKHVTITHIPRMNYNLRLLDLNLLFPLAIGIGPSRESWLFSQWIYV